MRPKRWRRSLTCTRLSRGTRESPMYGRSTLRRWLAEKMSRSDTATLKRGLTIEFMFVAAFIGAAFRSFVVMLASILPGIFPIVLSGTLLWALGDGLQFASVVALTVSFGLGLSATIHFLNRLRQEERPGQGPTVAGV